MTKPSRPSQQTRLLHDQAAPMAPVKTVNPAVQRGSTVLMPDSDALYDHGHITYGRAGLPIHQTLCDALSDLEGGLGTRLFPSGLAAITGALLAVLALMVVLVLSPSFLTGGR